MMQTMDLTPIVTTTNTTSATSKSPEPDGGGTPTRLYTSASAKQLNSTNGILKLHHHPLNQHLHGLPHNNNRPLTVVTYKECLKNHAATLGTHALDGCGEFMPSPSSKSADPTSLKCAACGCHRNFHRKDPEEPISPTAAAATTTTTTPTHLIEYQPHHRHHPLPPPAPSRLIPLSNRSPNSSSPPPISSSYYPSAPHMLLALSSGLSAPLENSPTHSRKRFRTKFSQEQKLKMYHLAERVGWKMQRRDDELIQDFCNEIGIDRGVLKVWLHNNKNSLGRKAVNINNNNNTNININGGGRAPDQEIVGHNRVQNDDKEEEDDHEEDNDHHMGRDEENEQHAGVNGGSS